MSRIIPFIRAAAIAPMRRWLADVGRDPSVFLTKADLHWVPPNDPFLPIPLRSAALFLREIARAEGPDVPHRIVTEQSPVDLGLIGMETLRGETLRDGFFRAAHAMPLHCSHEIFVVASREGALHIGDGWAATIGDEETRHLVQQYTVAVVEIICRLTDGPQPCISRIGMVPHPKAGLDHLRPSLGDRLYPNDRRMLDLEIPDHVADRPIPSRVQGQLPTFDPASIPPLLENNTLPGSVATLVAGMLPWTKPTLERAAFAAGVSRRTLQRRLRDEGLAFSDVLERTRAKIALSRLAEPTPTALKDLATELGYADQATLTRAVQRWTGQTPKDLRSKPSREHLY